MKGIVTSAVASTTFLSTLHNPRIEGTTEISQSKLSWHRRQVNWHVQIHGCLNLPGDLETSYSINLFLMNGLQYLESMVQTDLGAYITWCYVRTSLGQAFGVSISLSPCVFMYPNPVIPSLSFYLFSSPVCAQ